MKRDFKKINQIYRQLPDVLKAVYSSDKTTDFQLDMLTRYKIPINKRDAYLDLTYDTMLGLSPFDQLRKKLIIKEIVPEVNADACVRDIKNYIQPLLDYWAAGQKEQGTDQNIAEKSESQRLAETEAPTRITDNEPEQTVQPLRTMEGDLKRIHGYGSFSELYGSGETEEGLYKSDQDAVVKKNLAGTPTYNEPKAKS